MSKRPEEFENQSRSIWQKLEGNVFGTVVGNISGDAYFGQHPPQGRPRNEQILLNQVKAEVASRLKQSLHNAVFINLDKERQPHQVTRPWDVEVKVGKLPAEQLPKETGIAEVFDWDEIGGRLLILGQPGSGKTTTLLELARALLSRAYQQSDYPVPVLVNLSTWNDSYLSIRDWLIVALKLNYGVSNKLGQIWLTERKLLPLLDGLDELNPELQESCVRALNKFLNGENAPLYLVICSRIEEYEQVNTQLQLNGAICLKSLNNEQIERYFAQANYIELWEEVCQNKNLLALMRTPLILSVMLIAYWNTSSAKWHQLTSPEAQLQYILDSFIQRQVTCKNHPFTPLQTRVWLTWLAQQMKQESKTEFLIENLRVGDIPHYLQEKFLKFYILMTASIGFWVLTATFSPLLKWLYNFDKKLGIILTIFIVFNSVLTSRRWRDEFRFIFFKSPNKDALPPGVVESICFPNIKAVLKKSRTMLIRACIITSKASQGSRRNPLKPRKLDVIISRILFATFFIVIIILLIAYTIPDLTSKYLIFTIISLFPWLIISRQFGSTKGRLRIMMILNLSIFINIFFRSLTTEKNIEYRRMPNEGTFSSLKAFITCFALIWMIFIVIELTFIYFLRMPISLFDLILMSAGLGFSISAYCGGWFCLNHFILRLFLCINGCIPWNYSRFLDSCTKGLLLQRLGGRYRFMHKLIQEHFARMPFEKSRSL